jgi:hypothetical protein
VAVERTGYSWVGRLLPAHGFTEGEPDSLGTGLLFGPAMIGIGLWLLVRWLSLRRRLRLPALALINAKLETEGVAPTVARVMPRPSRAVPRHLANPRTPDLGQD